MTIPDHLDIQWMERNGYTGKTPPRNPICPICGAESDLVYCDNDKNIIGCHACIRTVSAWTRDECFPWEDATD